MSGVRDQVFTTNSEKETCERAAQFAAELRPGNIVLLSGDLGTGKTVFVRGLAEGLGIDPAEVTSPTFTLVHEYRGGRLPLIHVDLYRLEHVDLDEIGLDGDLASQGVVAIEWSERLIREPREAAHVRINDEGGDCREITVNLVPNP